MINIKKIIKQGAHKGDFPGGQFCYLTDETYQCGYVGFKQIEPNKVENKGDEIYDIASLTKVISTTILVFKLIEEGLWSLSTRLCDILHEFKIETITIKDLLIHSSGLKADIQRASKLKTRKEVIDKLFEAQTFYQKGDMVVYSDIGYLLLGLAIETTTGLSLDVAAETYIFKPLGMKDTSYHPDKTRTAPTEFRHDAVFQGLLNGFVHDEKSFAMGGIAGHAGVFSTANDIGLFIKAIMNDIFVLKRETVLKLFELQIEQIDQFGHMKARALGYEKPSIGHVLYPYQDEVIMHTGFTGCNLMINFKRKTGFVLLTNAVHPKREMNHIFSYRDEIYQAIIMEWEKKNA